MSQFGLIIPDNLVEIIDLVLNNKGYLFGGAVRDLIRGEIPSDLDVSIRNYENFYEKLALLGFNFLPSGKMIKDNIILDVLELDDPESFVEIGVPPDFDVNMLAWDGSKLFNYNNPDFDVTDIIYNIKVKRAFRINPRDERLSKMISKGWDIIN